MSKMIMVLLYDEYNDYGFVIWWVQWLWFCYM